ncbi:MAG: histidinol phosphate aminotransferase, partial [Sutterellaceae bacterium]|nr:histidinol phosphate aminotransferase [Sutterellaceae bacterium]
MSMNRRELFRFAGAGVGTLMLGSHAVQAASIAPKFVPPTPKSPLLLCFNENSLGMSASAKAAAQKALDQAARYPFVRAEALRKACATFMGGKPENIMLTHGSAES